MCRDWPVCWKHRSEATFWRNVYYVCWMMGGRGWTVLYLHKWVHTKFILWNERAQNHFNIKNCSSAWCLITVQNVIVHIIIGQNDMCTLMYVDLPLLSISCIITNYFVTHWFSSGAFVWLVIWKPVFISTGFFCNFFIYNLRMFDVA